MHPEAEFYGIGLGLGLKGPDLGLGLESCSDSFLASPSNLCKTIVLVILVIH